MKLKNKIILLYLSIITIFLICILVFFFLRIKEQNLYLKYKTKSDETVVDNFLASQTRYYLNPIKNNSEWNEMVRFANTRNYEWGKDNVGLIVPTFDLTFVWIYDKKFELIFYSDTNSFNTNRIVLTDLEVKEIFKNKTLCHSFVKKQNSLIELFGATIVPVYDVNHKVPPYGYIIGGKLWSKKYIHEISNSTGFKVSVNDKHELSSLTDENTESISRELKDIFGNVIYNVVFSKPEPFPKELKNIVLISLILVFISVFTLLLLFIFIKRWINNPIGNIIKCLDIENTSFLNELYDKNNEFARIAELIKHFYDQKDLLIQEIEEHKQTEEDLKQAMIAAEVANKAKSEFLANMSHEIRNPLNAIIGLSNMMARNKLTEDQKEIADLIKISTNKLLGIVNDILDFSKIEANKVELFNKNFNIEQILNELYLLFKPEAELKKLEFSYLIENDVPLQLYGDSGKLIQMLINLIYNAIKFTEKGFVKIHVKNSKNENDLIYIKFDVIDTGIGIKEEDVACLFQSFRQIDSSTTKPYSGTGLGLAIVKKYSELMNGSIQLSSEFGKGSIFTLEIPLRLSGEEENESKILFMTNDFDKAKIRILVAEDDAINQLYLKGFLTGSGFIVHTANNGLIAVEKYENNIYDIILMDGQMPKMDGFEATKIIREKEKMKNTGEHIPIIAITGYAVLGDKEKFMGIGMDDYISKPIDENILINLIYKYVVNINK